MDQEETLVDEADPAEDVGPDHHAAAIDDVHVGDCAARPLGARATGFRWKKPGRAGSLKTRPSVCTSCGGSMKPDDRADDAVGRVGSGRGRSRRDEVGGDDGVVVEQDDQVGAAFQGVADADVVAAGPAAVDGVLDDRAPGEVAAQRRGRILGGSVIHDDGIRPAGRVEGPQAATVSARPL